MDFRHSAAQPLRALTEGIKRLGLRRLRAHTDDRRKILWLYGSDQQSGWAYGVNAQRLAARLGKYRHFLGAKSRKRFMRYDLKFCFDLLIARSRTARKARAQASVLRVGGPAPLLQAAGGGREGLGARLDGFDGVIVLSPELQEMLRDLHPRVYFIPNGLDLEEWSPAALAPRDPQRPFRAGMAASLRNEAERELKGYPIAAEACAVADVPLLAVGRGANLVPHERMIEDFYAQIDVLVHPTGAGKEGCSNVIMEALALGIPVITTRDAGMHGQLLESGREAMVVPRSALDIAAALRALRADAALRRSLAADGRRFAERVHDLNAVARQYEAVFDSVLGMTQQRNSLSKLTIGRGS